MFLPHKLLGGGVLLGGKVMIETLMFSAFALYMTSKLSSNEAILNKSPISKPLAVLTALIIMASFFADNKPLALEAVLLFFTYISCFYIFLSILRQKKHQVNLVYVIVIITLYLCLLGLVQYYLFNLNPRLTSIWRLRSTFGNSNQMAGWLSMSIPLCAGLILSGRFSRHVFILLFLSMIIMIISLFFTFARGGWISTFAGLIFVLAFNSACWKQKNKKLLITAISTFMILLIFFLSSTDLAKRFGTMMQEDIEVVFNGRLQLARATMEMIKFHPITGVGPGNYASAFTEFEPPIIGRHYFAHNDYLHFISETGLLLIPIILWLTCSLFKYGFFKIKYSHQQDRGITLGAMGGLLALLIYSMGDFNLHIPANAMLFIVLSALVVSFTLNHPDARLSID